MASKTVRQLREDVTTRILTLTGWKESRVAPDNFGRDADSIAACDQLGLAMLVTGRRHFLH